MASIVLIAAAVLGLLAVVALVLGAGRSGGSRLLMAGLLVFLLLVLAVGGLIFMMRPQTVTLRVEGPPGVPIIGRVTVDGRSERVSAVTPAEFEYLVRNELDFLLIAEQPDPAHLLIFSGSGYGTYGSSIYGLDGHIETDRVGGLIPSGGSWWHGTLSEKDWKEEAAELLPEGAAVADGAE